MSPLKDYATRVSAEQTASEIQRRLAQAGARKVMIDYDREGDPTALSFAFETPHGTRHFTLPVRPEAVRKVLENQGLKASLCTPERARMVAWRITKDWIDAQLALAETEMVRLDVVMLPYMLTDDRGTTLYDLYAANQLPALGEGT